MKKTFVIGDVHGHLDRLEALLTQEGLLENGERPADKYENIEVIQLGDLGHFGGSNGSPTGDSMCWDKAYQWFDYVLWGNHDYALMDTRHKFNGFEEPNPIVYDFIDNMREEDRVKFAWEAHGFLITHAGLHANYKPIASSVKDIAKWLNEQSPDEAVIRSVPYRRGGSSPAGGILWRDRSEPLADIDQIFGHSVCDDPLKQIWTNKDTNEKFTNYNIDIGGKDNGRLAGIWLPEEKVVSVDLSRS